MSARLPAKLPSSLDAAHHLFLQSEARRFIADSAALSSLPARELCKQRWLFYRGDENYGLGNVLYDVSSAAALAIAMNRTLIYGIDSDDRKFGTLLTWPSIPTMADVDAMRQVAHCGGGSLASQRRALLAPDRCTFHRVWRREKAGSLRCLKRLLGVNWLAERSPVLELSKVHAFTGLQTLLKSTHPALRQRVAALIGGCVRGGERSNVHGALLSALMRPVPAVLHAVRWTLTTQQPFQVRAARELSHTELRRRGVTPPAMALHVRAMSDYRAKNLTATEQAEQMSTALRCLVAGGELASARRAAAPEAAMARTDAANGTAVFVASSSPELRSQLVRRIAQQPGLEPFVFEWRRYATKAPRSVVAALVASENAAAAFCAGVNASESFRCNRSAHLHDWGPEPHWVAVVELLLVASVSQVVVGAGYPYFKVCNTFCQVGAALADAAPPWLSELLQPRARRRDAPGVAAPHAPMTAVANAHAVGDERRPRGVRLVCASYAYSTDWGSSMWRALNATSRRGGDNIIDCGQPTCVATPIHPELWVDLHAPGGSCAADGDTMRTPYAVFGVPIKPLHAGKAKVRGSSGGIRNV